MKKLKKHVNIISTQCISYLYKIHTTPNNTLYIRQLKLSKIIIKIRSPKVLFVRFKKKGLPLFCFFTGFFQ